MKMSCPFGGRMNPGIAMTSSSGSKPNARMALALFDSRRDIGVDPVREGAVLRVVKGDVGQELRGTVRREENQLAGTHRQELVLQEQEQPDRER